MILLLVGLVLSFALYPPEEEGAIINTQQIIYFHQTFFTSNINSSCESIEPPDTLFCNLAVTYYNPHDVRSFHGWCGWTEINCSCINITGNTTLNITENDITENDITENDITENDITEND
ncbi:MAG: hypothetical protein N3C61_03130, partial [Candidatus Micrarchaeota archaeon]|nr:hypothetical protein [Candidatus Micrarchaeota archaeon]